MKLHDVSAQARKYLPGSVFRPLRAVGTACLTPLLFSVRSGHGLSALRSKALDRAGKPVLWITYPALDFLRAKNLTGCSVLEFGAGQSTLWWSEHVRKVVSFESDPKWHAYVSQNLPSNARVHLADIGLTGAERLLDREEKFDVALVDGLDRLKAAELASRYVKPGGIVLIDNSDAFSGDDHSFPIMRVLQRAGFKRVDFYGMAPGVIKPHCTSMFFGADNSLVDGADNPRDYGSD
jgi:SAM-dependent methyltransferase